MSAAGCRGSVLPVVDITLPTTAAFLDGVAILFSIVPLFVGLLAVVGMFVKRRVSLAVTVLLFLLLLILGEIIKGAAASVRPYGSCATSSGSGPTVVIQAFAFSTWLSLEMLLHQPQRLRLNKLGNVIAAMSLSIPVPAARLRLRDHSGLQLGVGIAVGVLIGFLWFILVKFVLARFIFPRIGESDFAQRIGIVVDYQIFGAPAASSDALDVNSESFVSCDIANPAPADGGFPALALDVDGPIDEGLDGPNHHSSSQSSSRRGEVKKNFVAFSFAGEMVEEQSVRSAESAGTGAHDARDGEAPSSSEA